MALMARLSGHVWVCIRPHKAEFLAREVSNVRVMQERTPAAQGAVTVDSAQGILPISVSIGGITVRRDGHRWYTHHSFGRIVDLLARRVRQVHYFGPEAPPSASAAAAFDYRFSSPNVTVHPWGARQSTLEALRHPLRLIGEFWQLTCTADAIFLRGSAPFGWAAHWMARLRGRGIVHWLVGNPVAILRGEQRGYGSMMQRLGLCFAIFEQTQMKIAIRVSRAQVLANGAEVAHIYRSPRTQTVVSSSITADDFREQPDTCTQSSIRLLFVGFIRPEKGLEYLIRALPLIQSERPVELAIVGSWGQFSTEKDRLDAIAREVDCEEDMSWEGYAAFGDDLFGQIDRSDILVLPSLSEGTPRVLVEARARGVPVVSTNVGGIPSSVTDGNDGLLVPPRDPPALAAAISRLINDGDARRRMIHAGRERVRDWTVERFVDRLIDALAATTKTKRP